MCSNKSFERILFQVGKYTVMVDDFEKVALDCLSNSFLRKAGLVVIDEVEQISTLILKMNNSQFCLVFLKSYRYRSVVIRLGLT